MLQYQTIAPKTLELLKKLQKVDFLRNTRLVGGTSLALQLGHRISIDIDLFGSFNLDYTEITEKLHKIGDLKIIKNSKNINIYSLDSVKVDIVHYTYPWLEPAYKKDTIQLAQLKDIAAMKLAAITGRGTKKDFVDLFYLLQHFSLKQMLNFYNQKYSDGSIFMVLKSLSYFEDADPELMPHMLIPTNWEEVKHSILKQLDGF